MTVLYNNPYEPDGAYQNYNNRNNITTRQLPMTLGIAIYLAWCAGLVAMITSILFFGSSCQTRNDDFDNEIDHPVTWRFRFSKTINFVLGIWIQITLHRNLTKLQFPQNRIYLAQRELKVKDVNHMMV